VEGDAEEKGRPQQQKKNATKINNHEKKGKQKESRKRHTTLVQPKQVNKTKIIIKGRHKDKTHTCTHLVPTSSPWYSSTNAGMPVETWNLCGYVEMPCACCLVVVCMYVRMYV
jgi:hypothetical protein